MTEEFIRLRPDELRVGDVLYHGYGYGTFTRLSIRDRDVVIHYQDYGGKRRSTRWQTHRRLWIVRREHDREDV